MVAPDDEIFDCETLDWDNGTGTGANAENFADHGWCDMCLPVLDCMAAPEPGSISEFKSFIDQSLRGD